MLTIRNRRLVFFLCALLVLIVTIGLLHLAEQQFCLGLPLLPEAELGQYTAVSGFDISQLRLNGEKIAVDTKNNTVYISQAANVLFRPSALQGRLETTNPNHTLFIVKNEALANIPSAVESGTPLSLIIVEGNLCQSVNIVITTLPVLSIEGTLSHTDDEDREVFAGRATLWAGYDPSTKAPSTTTGNLQWHVRGNTTAYEAKNPWKLSFKNENGENKNVALLGLGSDDDWILNSLTMDDTRIKEKLFMDLWNTLAAETDYNYKMSSGEYVELMLNGEYMGLFLLQRRLDAKYLELSDDDVLLKVTTYQATTPEEAYEFVTPEEDTQSIYAIMNAVLEGNTPSKYNLHNVIDVNLMLQLASAGDNMHLKNMYHVLQKTDQTYEHFLVPWDTDQSFGVVWKENIGFCYDYQFSLSGFSTRMETPALQKTYPEYPQAAAARWSELRQSLFTEENLLARIDALHAQLHASGALARDVSLWKNRYDEDDTIDSLKNYICDRLAYVDAQYR